MIRVACFRRARHHHDGIVRVWPIEERSLKWPPERVLKDGAAVAVFASTRLAPDRGGCGSWRSQDRESQYHQPWSIYWNDLLEAPSRLCPARPRRPPRTSAEPSRLAAVRANGSRALSVQPTPR